MSDLCAQVQLSIQARRLLPPGKPILVAVSGGVDSMVLLHVLANLAPIHQWRLTVAHCNHQLRGRSSDADERLVRKTSTRLKLPVVVERVFVKEAACARGISLEMAARHLRHEFLARIAVRTGIRQVALAHHLDDQIEHFFLRLLRGSGGQGLAGMKWHNPSPSNPEVELVRPLLEESKAALLEYAKEAAIPFREDASNTCLDIPRNRIRHQLLPLLRKDYQPALDKSVSRVIEIVGAETAFVREVASQWLRAQHPSGARRTQTQPIWVRTGLSFEQLPVAVQRCCLQMQLLALKLVPEYEYIEQLRLNVGRALCLPRSREWTTMGRKDSRTRTPSLGHSCQATAHSVLVVREADGIVRTQAPVRGRFQRGRLELALGSNRGKAVFDRVEVRWNIIESVSSTTVKRRNQMEVFDADAVGARIELRHWRPGDRFQPIGMINAVKLQDFFTNEKIPRSRRHELIVAASHSGEVFWVEGMRISERFKVTPATTRRLHWRWERLKSSVAVPDCQW